MYLNLPNLWYQLTASHPGWTDFANTRRILRLIRKTFLLETYHLKTGILVDCQATMGIRVLITSRKVYFQPYIIKL